MTARATWSAIVISKELTLIWAVEFQVFLKSLIPRLWSRFSKTGKLRKQEEQCLPTFFHNCILSPCPSCIFFSPLPLCSFLMMWVILRKMFCKMPLRTRARKRNGKCLRSKQSALSPVADTRSVTGDPATEASWAEDLSCRRAWDSSGPTPTEETAGKICHFGQRKKGVGWGRGLGKAIHFFLFNSVCVCMLAVA